MGRRSLGASFVLVLSLFGLVPIARADAVLRMQERTPLSFIFNAPTRDLSNSTRSDVLRQISDLAENHTDFFVEVIDDAVVGDCMGRLSCLALKARRDYHREALTEGAVGDRVRSYGTHLERLRSSGTPYPRYLLLLSSTVVGPGRDRLSAVLVDTDIALELHHDAIRQPGWKEEVEVAVSEKAVALSAERAEVTSTAATMEYLDRLFVEFLAPVLERSGHWEPYGSITVDAPAPGTSLFIDGSPVGALAQGRNRILSVRPGQRILRFETAGSGTTETILEVRRGETAHASVPVEAQGSTAHVLRKVTFWSGVGAATVGALVLVLGLTKSTDDVTSCFGCEPSRTFVTSRFDSDRLLAGDPVNPPGLLLAPLGLSLLAAGGTWSLGTAFVGDDTAAPWIQLGAGVGFGVLIYGLCTVLDGARPLGHER